VNSIIAAQFACILSITWGLKGEKPGFSEKPGFFPRTIEMIRLRRPVS
jgi:hypothetical protein